MDNPRADAPFFATYGFEKLGPNDRQSLLQRVERLGYEYIVSSFRQHWLDQVTHDLPHRSEYGLSSDLTYFLFQSDSNHRSVSFLLYSIWAWMSSTPYLKNHYQDREVPFRWLINFYTVSEQNSFIRTMKQMESHG